MEQEDFGSKFLRALTTCQAFPGPKVSIGHYAWLHSGYPRLQVWVAQAEVRVGEPSLIFSILLVYPLHVYRPGVFYRCVLSMSVGFILCS